MTSSWCVNRFIMNATRQQGNHRWKFQTQLLKLETIFFDILIILTNDCFNWFSIDKNECSSLTHPFTHSSLALSLTYQHNNQHLYIYAPSLTRSNIYKSTHSNHNFVIPPGPHSKTYDKIIWAFRPGVTHVLCCSVRNLLLGLELVRLTFL